jgi:hypothetical protein
MDRSMRAMFTANARTAIACATLALAGCGRETPLPTAAPPTASTAPAAGDASAQSDATRAWLARALTCGDRAFLRTDVQSQHARLMHMSGVHCEALTTGAPLRCTIAPTLRIAQAEIGWFVIGTPQFDLLPIVLPAPPEAVRNAMSAGTGNLLPGTDLGDTTVQCALTDEALTPGAIAGTVHREGDPAAAVRVCAFELAEGVPTCTQTAPGERTFRIDNLARGDYLVYAIPDDAPDVRIGYTGCDASDEDVGCTHELKVVSVEAGRATEPVDPEDLRSLDEAADWPQPPPMQ